jgi:hypothetical protein
MRTTINLEPEALAKAKLLSRQRGVSLGTIVSELILQATGAKRPARLRNGVPVFPRRQGAAPDMQTVNRLRD